MCVQVPLLMLQQHIPGLVINALRLQKLPPEDLPRWRELSDKVWCIAVVCVCVCVCVCVYVYFRDRLLR